MENSNCKVLLIEDDKIDQMAFMRLIKEENLAYDCTMVGTVLEAKKILKESKFDVVIADYLLRDGTAFDILDSVEKGTPIIFATGAGNEKLAVKAMKAGAYDYLIKNPSRSYLAILPLIIENAINHAKMAKEVNQYHEHLEDLVKERTEQLQSEKELLSITFSSMTDGVIVVDSNKHIVLLNNVAEKLIGVALEDAKGKSIDEIFSFIDERVREPIENPVDKVLISGKVQTRMEPSLLVMGNENEHLVSAAAAPICRHHESVSGAVMLLHDLSQEREIDQIKTDIVSSVSHELRTPLTSIKAYTETILRDPDMSDQQKRDFLVIIDKESNRLADLVSGLLEISQLESGGIERIKQSVSINSVIDQTISSLKRSADTKNIRIDVEYDGAIPLLSGNESKIRSMISNLVNNAIKFTPEGGQIRVWTKYQSEELEIFVSDTGVGIPEEEIPKIFDRFYRVQQTGKQISGTGLGLAIVNEVALMHGGKVDVESHLGQGTTFRVVLPVTCQLEYENAEK